MTPITKGANTPVPAAPLRVAVCRRHVPGGPVVDASVLLLDANGKVRGDRDLVFYNQPVHPSGTVRHMGTVEGDGRIAEWLEIDLPRIERAVRRLVVAGSCEGGAFGQVADLTLQSMAPDGSPVVSYAVTGASTETAFVLGEFYRRDGGWKFRAVGQGYASGLAGLATDFGIAVAQSTPVRPPEPPAPASPAPSPHVPAPPPHIPPAPAATPRQYPPQVPVPFAFGPEFAPVVRRGSGGDVVTVHEPIGRGPVVVEAWYEGEGYFAAHTLDARNREDELLFNTTVPGFRGRVLVHHTGDRALRLRVEADAAWTLVVQPVSAARHLTDGIQGNGPEVLVHHGTAADLDAAHFGDEDEGGCFALWCVEPARTPGPDIGDLLVNETGVVHHTVPIPDGPLLLRVEADGPWSFGLRPLPAPDPAAQAAGVHTGRGRGKVTLSNPVPGRPALLDYSIESDGSVFGHTVRIIDEYGDGEQLLRGSEDGARGRTLLFRNGESEVVLGVEGAGDWRLSLLPVETAPVLTGPAQGTGSEVFRYAGPPALLGLRRLTTDEGRLATRTVQAHGRTVVCADTGGRRRPAVGPLWVSGAGHCYVLVGAADHTGWHIEPTALQETPAFGRSVSGHGYGVVHHSGPETEVMLTHEPRGGLDALVVWALDERLEPVRRVSIGGGLQRLPTGYLQIRTMGRWTFEARG
ncbi:TerD family protein [Streptomyces sp. NBC_00178]|uniref:TerD family protein n=1 Tax=Streptomyces sp. NBC_00178 TaxID=2975672 RepID=UPI002E2C8CA8|nr:TerD family protein [Streptomyces sp. NBC_00178]